MDAITLGHRSNEKDSAVGAEPFSFLRAVCYYLIVQKLLVRLLFLLIDLHCHTYPKSDDGFMSVDELIDEAKTAGLDGVCLTEHDDFWTMSEVQELSRRHGFLVLAGSEINTDAGHALVFGLDRYEFGMHRPEFLADRVRRARGVIIAAHPYRRRFLAEQAQRLGVRDEMLDLACGDDFFRMCTAIEGLNGRGSGVQNQFSQDLGARLERALTAGSDAHRVEQLGTVATEFASGIESLDDLVLQLRDGSCRPVDMRDVEYPAHNQE